MIVPGFLRKMLTEGDNSTYCPVRVGMVGTGAVYHAAAAFMVIAQHQTLGMDMLGQYINHMSILGASTAGSVGAKALMKADAPK